MKFPFVLFTLILTATAHAQNPAPTSPAPVEKNPLIVVSDDCGYCDPKTAKDKYCAIDEDGIVKITNHANGVDSSYSWKLKEQAITELKRLVEATKDGKAEGTIQTYSGDAPSFGVFTYVGEKQITIEEYADGHVAIDSDDARSLARYSTRICSMTKKRLLWKYVLSKTKM